MKRKTEKCLGQWFVGSPARDKITARTGKFFAYIVGVVWTTQLH